MVDAVTGIAGVVGTLANVYSAKKSADLNRFASRIEGDSYKQAAETALLISKFNSTLDELNTTRRLNAQARQLRRVLSTQRTQAAASGISVASKSAQSISNETLSQFERNVKQEAFNLGQRISTREFDAAITKATAYMGAAGAALGVGQATLQGSKAIIQGVSSITQQTQSLLSTKTPEGGVIGRTSTGQLQEGG